MNIEHLSKLIKDRRSIFPQMYNDQDISEDTLLTILENANWAPNHKKTEPWRFKIFRGESRQLLSDFLGDHYETHTPKEKYSEVKHKKKRQNVLRSNVIIAICMYNDPNVSIPEWEEIAAVSCAVQNMWLSCTALGIGSYWSSPKSITEDRDFLQLTENEKCLGLFYMGYTDMKNLTSERKDINTKIEWM